MTVPVRVLKIDVVVDRVALSKSTIERAIKEGTFPKPFKLSVRAIGWIESDIEKWIHNRVKNITHIYE